MAFDTVTTYRTFYKMYVVGFHDTRFVEGDLFFSKEEADQYCSDKVVHVKEVKFTSKEEAESFVTNQLKVQLRQAKSLGFCKKRVIDETPCKAIKELLKSIEI